MTISNKDGRRLYGYVPINMGSFDQILTGTDLSPDRMRLLLSHLLITHLRHTNNRAGRGGFLRVEGWVAVDAITLKKLLTRQYTQYLDWAEQAGVIERRRDRITGNIKYVAGELSQMMRIAPGLLSAEGTLRYWRREPITEYKAIKALNALREQQCLKRESSRWYHLVSSTHLTLMEMNRSICFRIPEAEKYLSKRYRQARTEDTKRKMQSHLLTLEAINEGCMDYFKVDLFGNRLHTAITGLYSKLRRFMYFESIPDEPLIYIDIRSSQLYIASCLLAHPEIIEKILPEFSCCIRELSKYKNFIDVQDFYDKCCNGIIYESFVMTQSGTVSKEYERMRESAKKKTIRHLFSDPDEMISFFKEEYPNVDKAFSFIKTLGEKEFPFMHEFYTDKKTGKYIGDAASRKNLSRMTQLFESRIMLGKIAPVLKKQGLVPFTMIHDAIIIPQRDADRAEEIMREEFAKLGLTPPKFKKDIL